jgi:pimeloyl-ACP methyl ester carboxylesterase
MSRAGAALIFAAATGCAILPAPNPMTMVEVPPQGGARCVLVLFPGAGDHARDYETQGFLKHVTDRGLPVAVAAADATIGYYMNNSMQPRVEADVIAPLRAKYPGAKLWLAGISMGGFGALFYAQEHEQEVAGVLAMAPFLGGEEIAEEVRRSGGLSKWPAPAKQKPDNSNYQRQLWRWLKEMTLPGATGPELHLGYGVDDAISVQGAMLAAALPSGRVTIKPGGHVWAAWAPIFDEFLDSRAFRQSCGAP